jgi:hypothetical protein
MPKVTPKQKINFNTKRSSNEVVKLAKKGDTITLRFADYPVYYGRHWLEDEKTYVPCARINSEDLNNPARCEYCNRYETGEVEMKGKVSFIFPALNKSTGAAVFFETSQMIWNELQNQESKGIKIFDYDWLIERTENMPKYYEILRLERDPLTTKEQEAYDEAKKLNVESIIKFRINVKSLPKEKIITQDNILDESIFTEDNLKNIDAQGGSKEDEMPF